VSRVSVGLGVTRLLLLGLEGAQATRDARPGPVKQRAVVALIIAVDVPMSFANSKPLTPAASEFEAKVEHRS
jgi:hypothetical protein